VKKQFYPIPIILITVITSTALLTAPDNKVYTVQEALNNYEKLEGKTITIQGEIRQGSVACTQMFCGNNSCCNSYSGGIKLGGTSSVPLRGEEIGCSGNECNITCTPQTGKEYRVKGILNQSYGQKHFQIEKYSKVKQ